MIIKNSSNQSGANSVTLAPWHMKSWPWLLNALKALFLENYLAVSTWILKGSSNECLKEVSTFQFSWCSIWKPGESNFWVKICLAQEQTLFEVLCYVIAVTKENT